MRDPGPRRVRAQLRAANETLGASIVRLRHSEPVRRAAQQVRAIRHTVRRAQDPHASHTPPITTTARAWPMSVLCIGERSLPQCYHYRIRQKAELLESLDVPFDEVGVNDLPEALSRLQLARLLIIYRLPRDARMNALLHEAQRLRIPTVFEVDDVVHRRDLVASNPNLSTLPWALRSATIKGADDYRATLDSTQANLASTARLASDMKHLNGAPSFVVENGIDRQMLAVEAGVRKSPPAPRTGPVVLYGSGSRAHDRDFELAASGLARWLSENPTGSLRLIGTVAVPQVLVPHSAQITSLPELPFPEYLRELSRATVALAPLTDDPFNVFKSNIRYLESGLMGTPLVASPTLYADYIEPGRTGLLADGGEWFCAIDRLVRDEDLRRRISQQAREHVREWELSQRPRAQMRTFLSTLVPEWDDSACVS